MSPPSGAEMVVVVNIFIIFIPSSSLLGATLLTPLLKMLFIKCCATKEIINNILPSDIMRT